MDITKSISHLLGLIMLLGSAFVLGSCETEEETLPEIKPIEGKSVSAKKNTVPNLTGYYVGDDLGHYYIRQVGHEIMWFGEDPSRVWANVFQGTLDGMEITGTLYDVPKGENSLSGALRYRVNSTGTEIRGGRFGLGPGILTRSTTPSDLPGERPEGYGVRNDIDNLTAKWHADNGGTYYIRQIANRIIWFGEDDYVSGRPIWSNVAFGIRAGNRIDLRWADVPKGDNNFEGTLRMKVLESNTLEKVNQTGGFGGDIWTR